MFTAVAELAVLRALELAGDRIIRWAERSSRGPLKAFKPISVHVQRPVAEADLEEVLPKGAWIIPAVAGLPEELIEALDRHTRILLVAGLEFQRKDLTLSRIPIEKMPLPWESGAPRG
ncbi:hypothetical protein [Streptomyces sp. NPDC005970]|uniref:hypothetical protein n=1 Tax=Streptomyces sp. NPDC005970 TaxID=3156723 RepID=UPI0033FF7308